MAAPHVAGLVALAMQAAEQEGHRLTTQEIRNLLIDTARKIYPCATGAWDPRLGAGSIDGRGIIRRVKSKYSKDN